MSPKDSPDTLSVDDAKHLLRLCRAGRLYEIEEWIGAGRPLTVPNGIRTTPLDVAIQTRLHSLIDLLLRHEGNQQIKNSVLQEGLLQGRRDLVDLALKHGAETASVSFLDVLLSWDRELASFFLDTGADPTTGMPFAHAFHQRVRTALGAYLDCRRNHPELAGRLQNQADVALRQFCQDGNLSIGLAKSVLRAAAEPGRRGTALRLQAMRCRIGIRTWPASLWA